MAHVAWSATFYAASPLKYTFNGLKYQAFQACTLHYSLPNVFFRMIGPPRKQTGPDTRHEPDLRLKLEVWVTIRIKEARWEPGTGGGCRRRFLERTRAEERKGPGGRNSTVSSVKKHNSGRQHRASRVNLEPDISKWHEDVSRKNMLLLGIVLVGVSSDTMFVLPSILLWLMVQ